MAGQRSPKVMANAVIKLLSAILRDTAALRDVACSFTAQFGH